MKKTLLISWDFPPQTGGVARYWGNLCQYLPSGDLVVLAPQNIKSNDFDSEQKYIVERTKMKFTSKFVWPKWLPLVWQVFSLIRKHKIEHILVSEVLPTGTVALLIKWIKKIPYTLSFHGMDIAWAMRQKRKNFLLRLILKNSHSILTNSKYTSKLILDFLPSVEAKIIVVYPGLSIQDKKTSYIAFSPDKNRFIVLSVGRLVERKGFDKSIEAIKALKNRYPDILYIIVGQGEYESTLRQIVLDNQLENWVKIYNKVSDSELSGFYQSAKVFLMPSRSLANGDVEGFGIVYLEANYYGLPVIAGNVGGMPEAVENNVNGLVVDGEKVIDIISAIQTIIENPEKAKKMAEMGKTRINMIFSSEIQVQKIKELLK